MQENEFEKQVQQKMDELKLNPSASVWESIELKIRKEKTRRRAFIYLPLLIICCVLFGYFAWNISLNKKQNSHEFIKNIFTTKSDSGNIQTQAGTGKDILKENKISNISAPAKKLINQTISLKKSNYQVYKKSIFHSVTKSKVNIKVQQANASDVTENEAEPEIYKENLVSENTFSNKEIKSNDKSISDSSIKIFENDTLKIQKENQLTPDKKISAVNKKNKKKSSWNLGLTLSGGISDVITDNTLNPQSYSQDLASTPAYPYNVNFVPKSPSSIHSSGALTVGFFIEKKLFKSLRFKSGLNYKMLGASNLTVKDSTLLARQGSSTYYRNYYHFIEVPVELEVLLFNLKKLNVYWNAGLSISRYLGGNALQFDYVTGLYYKGDLFLNKTQVSLSTGLPLSIIGKRKNSILLGPFLEYGISKLSDKGLYTNGHSIYTGLKTQIGFNKK